MSIVKLYSNTGLFLFSFFTNSGLFIIFLMESLRSPYVAWSDLELWSPYFSLLSIGATHATMPGQVHLFVDYLSLTVFLSKWESCCCNTSHMWLKKKKILVSLLSGPSLKQFAGPRINWSSLWLPSVLLENSPKESQITISCRQLAVPCAEK